MIPATCDNQWLAGRITWYTAARATGETLVEMDRYTRYAHVLEAVLKHVQKQAAPLGMVATRSKDPASFADKCVRKFASFRKDPTYQFTDLCGGRIVVNTPSELDVVCNLLRKILTIVQEDDTRTRLSANEFGYRSVHFDVEIDPQRLPTALREAHREDLEAINGPGSDGAPIRRRAEVQVRTHLQHAWADILHDRLYKTHLVLPNVYRRQAATLAARLEDLDNDFQVLADHVDAYEVDYGAYMTDEDKRRRLASLDLLLEQPAIGMTRKQVFALEAMRLHRALGEWDRVAALAQDYSSETALPAIRFLAALAACQTSLSRAGTLRDKELFLHGQTQIQALISCPHEAESTGCLRCEERSPFRAQVLGAAGWCVMKRRERNFIRDALELHRRASNCAPGNPYLLRKLIECQALEQRSADFVRVMFTRLEEAIRRCEEHIEARTELPGAYFTAGALLLFLGRDAEGLTCFCRGALETSDTGVLREEMEMASDLCDYLPEPAGQPFRMLRLMLAAFLIRDEKQPTALWDSVEDCLGRKVPVLPPERAQGDVLIVAGGAQSLSRERASAFGTDLATALAGWSGTILSGGTRCGVPGAVGDAIEKLSSEAIGAIAVRPSLLPADAPEDDRYHSVIDTNPTHGFSALDVVVCWLCLLRSGVTPRRVKVLGFGGGDIALVEYALAAAMGALVGVVNESGGAADRILKTEDTWPDGRLLALPADTMTFRAFVFSEDEPQRHEEFDAAARFAHEAYRSARSASDPQLRPWPELADTFKFSNYDQVVYAAKVLASEGLDLVKKAEPRVVDLQTLVNKDAIGRMAKQEHGRWNVERLRQGWHYAEETDRGSRHHADMVSWERLPDDVQAWDTNAVLALPRALAASGFEVVANTGKKGLSE